MQMRQQLLLPGGQTTRYTLRTLLAAVFRQKRIIVLAFSVVFIPVLAVVLLQPPQYMSETKLLLERQRSAPVITSNYAKVANLDTTVLDRVGEQEIDSEIDLIQSDDLLRQVVIACDLWKKVPAWRKLLPIPLASTDVRIADATDRLRTQLTIDPPNRSNVVTIRYYSRAPQEAASVLRALTNLYMKKHLEVHRPPGSTEFFNQEVESNRRAYEETQNKLVQFAKSNGVVAADAERAATLQRMTDFQSGLQTTQGQFAATQRRIDDLEAQLKRVPPRITTKVRSASALLEDLKSSLYDLEMKRSELLAKYQPGYRPVQDLDKQIADTRAAIAAAEKSPTNETETDLDPGHVWLETELEKARADLVALRAMAGQTKQTIGQYEQRALHLDELAAKQSELQGDAKATEEAYLGSLQKQSEARLSEALDRARIMNVAVAEQALVPVLPVSSRLTRVLLGLGLAMIVALGLGFLADYLDQSFRTPEEVEAFFDVPVLAALPNAHALAGESAYSRRNALTA